MTAEHFIPYRKADVIALCADELPATERESFLGFTRMLSSLLHHRFHDRIEALKDAYHPFNPEADTQTVRQLSPAERAAARQRLEEELVGLARAANFVQIDPADLDQAFVQHSLLKVRLEVDLDAIDTVLFFRRGESVQTREVKTWYGLRRSTVEFTNYGRVLVYVVFKDARHFENPDRLPFRPGSMIVKLFQNVPRDDLEMVFPNVQVRMRGIDKWLIGIPAVISGIVIVATKLLATAGLVIALIAVWLKLSHDTVEIKPAALISFGAGLFAFGGYVVRQLSNFKNRKIQFMKALSENLYFRNLDNDAGVFHHLLDEAEEAEVKETVLAYHYIRTAPRPLTPAELDHRIEDRFTGRFNFEIEDGLRKLRELSLVVETPDGKLTAVSLAEAKQRMDRIWDDTFDYGAEAVPSGA